MPSKLKFRVIEVSSCSEEHEASLLNSQLACTDGWRTCRNCSYPQRLVLQLKDRARLRKIQIMLHHQLIPKKIEICGADNDGEHRCLNVQHFGHVRCLGGLQDQCNPREMKSVYVDVVVTHIILNLFENHPHEDNPYNQVSIVGINLLGDYGTRSIESQTYSPLDDLAYLLTNDQQIIQIIRVLTKKLSCLKLIDDDEDDNEVNSLNSKIIKLEEVSKQLVALEQHKMKLLDEGDNKKAQVVRRRMDGLRMKIYNELHLNDVLEDEIEEEDDDDFANSVSVQIVPFEESEFRLENLKTIEDEVKGNNDKNKTNKNNQYYDNDSKNEDNNIKFEARNNSSKKVIKSKLDNTFNISEQPKIVTNNVHDDDNDDDDDNDNDDDKEEYYTCPNNENDENKFDMMSLIKGLEDGSDVPNNMGSANLMNDGNLNSNYQNDSVPSVINNTVTTNKKMKVLRTPIKEIAKHQIDHKPVNKLKINNITTTNNTTATTVTTSTVSIAITNDNDNNVLNTSTQSKKSKQRSSYAISNNNNNNSNNINNNNSNNNNIIKSRIDNVGSNMSHEMSAYAYYEERPLPTFRNKVTQQEPLDPESMNIDLVTDPSSLEPLSEQDQKEASVVIDRFGMDVACKLWSKKWTYRLEALESIKNEVESYKENVDSSVVGGNNSRRVNNNNSILSLDSKESRSQYLKAFNLIFQKNIKDHIFQVYQALLNLTYSFLKTFQTSSSNQRPLSLPTLDLIIPTLILKLGDNSSKQHREATKSLLIQMYNSPELKCQNPICQECMKFVCRNNSSSKLLVLNVLMLLHVLYVENQLKDCHLTTDQLMQFLIFCLSNNHREVREGTEDFVMDVYKNNRQLVRGYFPADESIKNKTAKNILYKHLLNKFDAIDVTNVDEQQGSSVVALQQQQQPQQPQPQQQPQQQQKQSQQGQSNVNVPVTQVKSIEKQIQRRSDLTSERVNQITNNNMLKPQNKINGGKQKNNPTKQVTKDHASPSGKSLSEKRSLNPIELNNKENKTKNIPQRSPLKQQHQQPIPSKQQPQKARQLPTQIQQKEEPLKDFNDHCICLFCGVEQLTSQMEDHHSFHCPILMRCPNCPYHTEVSQYYKHVKGCQNISDSDRRSKIKNITKDKCPLCLETVVPDSNVVDDDDDDPDKYFDLWKFHLMERCSMSRK